MVISFIKDAFMNYKILSGNALKLIAAVSMLLDHIGLLFFPSYGIFRIFGRLALPIFAFMIAESAKYTRNKKRHFFTMFSLAAVCQAVYYIFDSGSLYMCILVTFSISTLLIYALQNFKRTLFSKNADTFDKVLSGAIFFGGILATFVLNSLITIDYGFIGCILPVSVSLFDFKDIDAPEKYKKLDRLEYKLICFAVPLVALIISNMMRQVFIIPYTQMFSLLSIPLLLLYSGKRGTPKLKYFFYIFYPVHLALLEGIVMLSRLL